MQCSLATLNLSTNSSQVLSSDSFGPRRTNLIKRSIDLGLNLFCCFAASSVNTEKPCSTFVVLGVISNAYFSSLQGPGTTLCRRSDRHKLYLKLQDDCLYMIPLDLLLIFLMKLAFLFLYFGNPLLVSLSHQNL